MAGCASGACNKLVFDVVGSVPVGSVPAPLRFPIVPSSGATTNSARSRTSRVLAVERTATLSASSALAAAATAGTSVAAAAGATATSSAAPSSPTGSFASTAAASWQLGASGETVGAAIVAATSAVADLPTSSVDAAAEEKCEEDDDVDEYAGGLSNVIAISGVARGMSNGGLSTEIEKVAAAARRAILDGRRALQSVGVERPVHLTTPGDSSGDGLDCGSQACDRGRAVSSGSGDVVRSSELSPPSPKLVRGLWGERAALTTHHEAATSPSVVSAVFAGVSTLPETHDAYRDDQPLEQVILHDACANEPREAACLDATIRESFERERFERERDERRRAHQREIERQALELERSYERRIQHRNNEAALAEERSGELRVQLEAFQEEREQRERELREEIAEVRSATRRTEAQAKQRAKVFRDNRERSEKELAQLRERAKGVAQARADAQKQERAALARVRRETAELSEERAQLARSSEHISQQLAEGEREVALASQELSEAQQNTEELRSVGKLLQTRAAEEEGAADTLFTDASLRSGHSRVAQASDVADALVDRAVLAEEAVLGSEMRREQAQEREMAEEHCIVLRRIDQVESEAEQLRGVLRGGGSVLADDERSTERLVQQRDAARLELSQLRDELAQASAAAAARVVVDEASDSANRREAAAAEELDLVYEQLRAVCSNGRRDLEELAATIEERQASMSFSRELELSWALSPHEEVSMARANTATANGASEILASASECHDKEMRELQAKHLRATISAELHICDLEISYGELREARWQEETRRAVIESELRRMRCSAAVSSVSSHGGGRMPLPETSLAAFDSEFTQLGRYKYSHVLAPLQRARNALAATVDGLDGQDLGERFDAVLSELQHVCEARANVEASLAAEEEAAAEALVVVRSARGEGVFAAGFIDSMSDVLQEEHAAFEAECNVLRDRALRSREELKKYNDTREWESAVRAAARRRVEEAMVEQITETRRRAARAEDEAEEVGFAVSKLEAQVEAASEECAAARNKAECEAVATLEARRRLTELGKADLLLAEEYHLLESRTGAAGRACEQEEEAVHAVSVELDKVRASRAIAEAETHAEEAKCRATAAENDAARAASRASQTTFEEETKQHNELEEGIVLLQHELLVEREAADRFEVQALVEAEENAATAETLAELRAETEPLRRAWNRESAAVLDLRHEIEDSIHDIQRATIKQWVSDLGAPGERSVLDSVGGGASLDCSGGAAGTQRQSSPSPTSARNFGDLTEALRHERINADVLEALSHATRKQKLLLDSLPSPERAEQSVANQLKLAELVLEERHEETMAEMRARSTERRTELEAEVSEHSARFNELEDQLQSRRSAWQDDRDRLERRVISGENEHRQLEHNLLREISRLECTAAESGDDGGRGGSSAGTYRGPPEVAQMSAALRETYGFLCQQQRQLEDATRERDQLQAHLVTALERVSRRHAGVFSEPPVSTPASRPIITSAASTTGTAPLFQITQ